MSAHKVFEIEEKIAPAARGKSVTQAKTHTEPGLETHLERACAFQIHSERGQVDT